MAAIGAVPSVDPGVQSQCSANMFAHEFDQISDYRVCHRRRQDIATRHHRPQCRFSFPATRLPVRGLFFAEQFFARGMAVRSPILQQC